MLENEEQMLRFTMYLKGNVAVPKSASLAEMSDVIDEDNCSPNHFSSPSFWPYVVKTPR